MPQCSGSLGELFVDGQFFDAILCPHTEVAGLLVFGLLVYGAIGFLEGLVAIFRSPERTASEKP